ncbi:hypothetical protein KUCAC02_008631, partial [Chaenocephalus aceratus]
GNQCVFVSFDSRPADHTDVSPASSVAFGTLRPGISPWVAPEMYRMRISAAVRMHLRVLGKESRQVTGQPLSVHGGAIACFRLLDGG